MNTENITPLFDEEEYLHIKRHLESGLSWSSAFKFLFGVQADVSDSDKLGLLPDSHFTLPLNLENTNSSQKLMAMMLVTYFIKYPQSMVIFVSENPQAVWRCVGEVIALACKRFRVLSLHLVGSGEYFTVKYFERIWCINVKTYRYDTIETFAGYHCLDNCMFMVENHSSLSEGDAEFLTYTWESLVEVDYQS